MDRLDPDILLQRVPELKIELRGAGHIELFVGGQQVQGGPHGLRILDIFSTPRTLKDALADPAVAAKGRQDWADFAATALAFYRAGVLRPAADRAPAVDSRARGFDAPTIHVRMLDDRERTARYIAAIREVVRPGDVVVDLGTGTGVLATAAAQAGARRVYAIEAGAIGKVAREVFAANQVADRVTLVEGWSTQVELPERADVLVSEIIGNDPLAEGVLPATADARHRLLKPDARLVPAAIRVLGLPLEIPPGTLAEHTFVPGQMERWKNWYDIDFSPLHQALTRNVRSFYIRPHAARDWKLLGPPILLAEFSLDNTGGFFIDASATAAAEQGGDLNGVLIYFDLSLTLQQSLSSHPSQAGETHWRCPLWHLPHGPRVEPGARFRLDYAQRAVGKADGLHIELLDA